MSFKRQIIGTFGTQILALFFGLAGSILSSRLLGPTGKGEFSIFIASIGLLQLILGMGLPNSMSYFVARNEKMAGKLFWTILIHHSILAFLFTYGLVIYYHFDDKSIFLPDGKDSFPLQLILGGGLFLAMISNSTMGILSGLLRFMQVNFLNLLSSGLLLLIYLILIPYRYSLGKYLDVEWVLYLYFFIMLIVSMFSIMSITNHALTTDLKFLNKGEFKELISWGGRSYGADILQFLNYRLDFWIVNYFLGGTALGIYSLSGSLAQLLWLLPTSIASVLLPTVASSGEDSQLEKTLCIGRIGLFFAGIVAIIISILSPILIPILYGSDFQEASWILTILLIGVTPFCLTKVYAAFLAGNDLVIVNFFASGIGLIVTLCLDFTLIPLLGIKGAALASSCSYVVTSFYVLLVMNRKYHMPWASLTIIQHSDISMIFNFFKRVYKTSKRN